MNRSHIFGGHFHFLAITNNTAVNIYVQGFVYRHVFLFVLIIHIYLGVKLVGQRGTLCLSF